ncbi:Procollagen-lysine,2-oxoglutarate 5-dioxygenase 3 [Echinococcus granulosus]|uniref:Procollagen-lysine,2-oxoglutarate 5-dioxygenase 3 n=1 Tax=Echinococcus granulosus TaxID=6210 RepID=W6UPC3_ECHGR|nr:Procollagen-lysine,2-oxoglutarate 5-dioxygenase 3 [Echinococcus granulosus]EUB62621.1 Procollagen-lysine,2-oxoglutarate 5-dioxygenase 3 [Echinococcus granulosus]
MSLGVLYVLAIIFRQSLARGSSSFSCILFLELFVYTVATDDNDALQRFQRSAETHGFNVKVLGSGEAWLGGDVASFPGGGQKIRFLKDALEPLSQDTEKLVLFVDSYDVVFMDSVDSFLHKYDTLQHRVIFSAEKFCWPQPSLMSKYPVVDENESRFLNSGSFVGPIADIFRIISHSPIENEDDDQLFYTKIFLDLSLRQELDIALDTRSELFQNLNGALGDIRIDYNEDTGYLVNTRTNTRPVVAHGNGPIKPNAYPVVQISAFIAAPTPFVEDFFKYLDQLNYPKMRIYLTLYCNVEEHYAALLEFNVTRGYEYKSAIVISESTYKTDISAKNHAWSLCLGHEDCAFVLTIDSMARLTNPNTLNHLVRMNRNVMAPLLTRIGKLWSNFWGALNRDGYYARSSDYVDIINRRQKQVQPTLTILSRLLQGIWNVPFVSNCYMFSRWTARQLVNHLPQEDSFPDMTLSKLIREKNIFLFVDNQEYFGHLINPDTYKLNHLHNDMWQIFDNPVEWEKKYLHPDYHKYINRSFSGFEQPCPDVFWFPLLSEQFCRDMIEELEFTGLWSTGSNIDPRLEGGYENVPTIDTHMRQIDWEAHWLHVLATYVRPIQRIVFEGYEDLPTARMNFVVRYKPDEQHSLRPHHDSSTYTLNIALNRPGFDYQARECLTHPRLLISVSSNFSLSGGGARFVRYDCAVVRSRLGWALMHPGRLTHLHEGLRTTHGIRYIFITFVNP